MTLTPSSKVNKLTDCDSVDLLADFFSVSKSYLLSTLYSKKILYREYKIPKKAGGDRTIDAPVKILKVWQQKLKHEFELLYSPRAAAHGFIKDRSIVTNAKQHLQKRLILNIDLEDFFGSITFGRVKRMLQSSPFNLNHKVATVVAHICCHEGRLPQGAPTSPIVSNIIAFKLDNQLTKLAIKYRFTYTRYSDDITFSFRQKLGVISSTVLKRVDGKVRLGDDVIKIVTQNGFEVNHKKTRLLEKHTRQSVNNITVNQKLNVNRKFLRQTSAMLNAALNYGPIKAEHEYLSKYQSGYLPIRQIKKSKENRGVLFVQIIKGRLDFIRSVRGHTCPIWRKMMYGYTCLIGEPDERYDLSLDALAARSTLVVHNTVGQDGSIGTAFYLKDFGIITNSHVIQGIERENMTSSLILDWLTNTKLEFVDIELALNSEDYDIAILTSTIAEKNLPHLDIESKPDYSRGNVVYLIGYPNFTTGDNYSVLKTKISGSFKSHRGHERIRVRDTVYHGMSGGAVLNEDGRVIGIVSNGVKYGNQSQLPFGFIPISSLHEAVEQEDRKPKLVVVETD